MDYYSAIVPEPAAAAPAVDAVAVVAVADAVAAAAAGDAQLARHDAVTDREQFLRHIPLLLRLPRVSKNRMVADSRSELSCLVICPSRRMIGMGRMGVRRRMP